MPRTKQLAVCLFCNEDPCTCFGKKEKKSAPRKKAAPKQTVTTVELPPASDETEEREAVPVFPSQSGRKRAKFAKASKPASSEGVADGGETVTGLSQDPTSVAIRTLAAARMLHPKELIKHHDKLVPPHDPDLDRQLTEWRRRRATQ